MKEIVTIDGSYGEGGGQILRTSIAMAALTKKATRIINIRKKRPKPGLKAQHVKAIELVARLCNAKVIGNRIGSEEVIFYPGEISARKLEARIETAGSIALALQGVMIALLSSREPCEIVIRGGAVAGKWAPPVNYLRYVLLPLLAKFGYRASVEIKRYGYYPKGGAHVVFKYEPSELKEIKLTERGKLKRIICTIHASKLLSGKNVVERMRKVVIDELGAYKDELEVHAAYFDSLCPGCGIEIAIYYKNTILGSDAVCSREKRSEDVAKSATSYAKYLLNSDACVDLHTLDQIIPFLAIASLNSESTCEVKFHELTMHAKTNIYVVERFLPVKFEIKGKELCCLPMRR